MSGLPGALRLKPSPGRSGTMLLPVLLLGVVALCLIIATQGPRTIGLAAVLAIGCFVLGWLVISPRYEISLAILLLYIGLVDGYLKLKSGSTYATLGRDILLYAVAAGAAVRLIAQRTVFVPPYTGWILLFVGAAVVQVAHPENRSILHGLAALKPHLEFVPLFFLGFAVMRTTQRLRIFLLLLLVITAVNGVVAYYQYTLTPEQLASWGPGYERLIEGEGSVSGRVALGSGDEPRVRPFGLGSDTGFSGGLAAIAAPAVLALLTLARRRATRAVTLVLGGGVVLALVASQARIALIAAALSLIAYAALSGFLRRRLQLVAGLAIAGVLSWLVVSILSNQVGVAVFERYETIAPSRVLAETAEYKRSSFEALGTYFHEFPLGAGLGKVGPASGFVGGSSVDLNAENQFNYLLLELGYPGLLVVVAFLVQLSLLIVRRVRTVTDSETRALLVAIGAGLIATFATFAGGPVLAGPPGAPFLWFAAGVLVYWLAPPKPPGRAAAQGR